MGLLSSFINEMIFLQEHRFVSKSDKRKDVVEVVKSNSDEW
jgi:hypothetical protein